MGADAGLHANQAGRQVGELASGIDKNTFHLVGLNKRGAIVLRQELPRLTLPGSTQLREPQKVQVSTSLPPATAATNSRLEPTI